MSDEYAQYPFLELIGKDIEQARVLLPEIRRRAALLATPYGRERLAAAEAKRARKAAKAAAHG